MKKVVLLLTASSRGVPRGAIAGVLGFIVVTGILPIVMGRRNRVTLLLSRRPPMLRLLSLTESFVWCHINEGAEPHQPAPHHQERLSWGAQQNPQGLEITILGRNQMLEKDTYPLLYANKHIPEQLNVNWVLII